MAEVETREREEAPGRIVRIVGTRSNEPVIDIEEEGLGRAVRVPPGQRDQLQSLLNNNPERDRILLFQRQKKRLGRVVTGDWEGVVLAGPFGPEVKVKKDLIGDLQFIRWFNQFLGPENKTVAFVEGVRGDPVYGIIFEGKGAKKEFSLDEVVSSMGESAFREVRERPK